MVDSIPMGLKHMSRDHWTVSQWLDRVLPCQLLPLQKCSSVAMTATSTLQRPFKTTIVAMVGHRFRLELP